MNEFAIRLAFVSVLVLTVTGAVPLIIGAFFTIAFALVKALAISVVIIYAFQLLGDKYAQTTS
ncbi:MAG: hypothetical protein K5Q00_05645 [Gammaproteobacteria bacterium]|nr:hypothetical protein [Gammaproteobacteria bacterium]